MVSIKAVQASNAAFANTLPGLVAVFVGATTGIGEYSLREFARYAREPRVYLIGRNQANGDKVAAECKALNPEGSFTFLKADVSLMRNVDVVCEEIKSREKTINLLFMTQGSLDFRAQTEDNIPLMAALPYYSRTRFAINLLPLLQAAHGFRRVVTVFTGGKEGKVFVDDVHGKKVGLLSMRPHAATLCTTALMALAEKAPEVTFIHSFPGHVKTSLGNTLPGIVGMVARTPMPILPTKTMPATECGERYVYLATSSRWPAAVGEKTENGVALSDGVDVARAVDGRTGSGVYSVDEQNESASPEVEQLLMGYKNDGTVKVLWTKFEDEFKRVLG